MKQKTLFYCTACGNEFPKWAGKCPACGAWNTIVEQPETPKSSRGSGAGPRRRGKDLWQGGGPGGSGRPPGLSGDGAGGG